MLVVAVLAGCTGGEARKQSFVAKGQQHMREHEWQKARLDFRNALQIDPKNMKVQFLAAQAAEHAGEYNEAAGRYRTVLDHDKTNVAARAALGRLYAGGGLEAEAIKLAEEGLAVNPREPSLLTVRGAARSIRGDFAGALQDAEAAYALTPADPDAATLVASQYARQGRYEEAIGALRHAAARAPDNVPLRVVTVQLLVSLDRVAEAEKELRALVQLEPRELKHRYRLAQFYVLQKQEDAAEETLRNAVASAPDEVEPKLALADLIASQRSFTTGEKQLKDLVQSDKGNLALRLGLGRFYEVHQRSPSAESVYRDIVKDAGDNAQGLAARNRLAALALEAHRSTDANALIEEILRANPRDNEALTMRAEIALARGDAPRAIADLRAVLRDQPDASAPMRALAQAYAENHDMGLAEETLRTAIRAHPTDIATRLALADLLIRTGRADQAQPVADHLVTDYPGDVAALEGAFRVQVQQRDLDGARKSALTIQSLRPDLPTGYYLVGLVDEAGGKVDAARASFEHAASVAPGAVEPVAAAVRVDLSQHQSQRALGRVDAALSLAPSPGALQELKAEILLQLKRYDEAASTLGEVINQSPAWWVPYHNLAMAEVGRGRSDAAVAAYQRGLDATGAAPPLVTKFAQLHVRMGRADEAIKLYDAWLQREPGSEVASNNCAMLLVTYHPTDPKSVARAVELSRRLANSAQPAFIDTLGWVSFIRGDYDGAVTALQRAVDAAPTEPEYRAHLGLAQYRAHRHDEAQANLKQALTAAPELPEAADVKSALRDMERGAKSGG